MNETPQTERPEQNAANVDLGLRPGMTVEVLTMENRLTFVGKVESFRGGAVVIREAKGDELPPVLYNKEIKLRFFRERSNLVLQGKICGSSRSIWKVDRLESQFSKEQRAFFRQRISPNTPAVCTRRTSLGSPTKQSDPCNVIDISAGGVLISSREEYQVDDRLSIDRVCLEGTPEPFDFRCKVRRVGEREMGSVRYGCQFETLSAKEQDRLLRAIFIVQRAEIRNQKEREEL